ncbi:uncharacterized protein BXZ73DRAFT_82854 [Epithele typhae]|uniref:uncharacterized protein n=1 Tax=Epithele typhae TaxID=378194 RepID=UPI00200726B2|nr:uncharacterized protein BXZ73DRAFT_82854 [Epithele typhae]KAH9911321.1 hypothetical protein BXZ73DRAFT_82854 [Epithele typhae]
MSTNVTAPPLDVPASFGPFFIAVILDVFLYGIVSTQAFLYFTSYKNDPQWMKVLVGIVVISDTLNSCFDVISVYQPLVLHFGDYQAVLVTQWAEFHSDPAITAIVAFLVQSFFAWRVKVLTKNKWIVGFIYTCAFISLLGGIGTSIAVTKVPYIPDFPKFQSIVNVWLPSAVVADITITATLVLHLRKRKTGMKFTDTLINKITRLTIETGLLTALWALTDLIVYLVVPTALHLVFNFTLSKLYSISLLTSLITRHGAMDGSTGDDSHDGARANPMPGRVNMLRSNASAHQPQQIFIDVEAHEMVEVDDIKGPQFLESGKKSANSAALHASRNTRTSTTDHSMV